MNATETTPSRFETALEKAKRAIALRAEVAKLETDVRHAIHILSHEGSAHETEKIVR